MRAAIDSRLNKARTRAGEAGDSVIGLLRAAVGGFFEHNGTQLAAATSFFLLLSIFPLAIVATAIGGLIAGDGQARMDVIDFFVRNLPLTEQGGTQDLEHALRGVTDHAGQVGAIGLIGLVFSASAVVGSIRNALNVIWKEQSSRPPVIGKLFDLLLAAAAGVLVAGSLGVTLLHEALVKAGGFGQTLANLTDNTGPLVPVLLAAALFAFMLRVIPGPATPLRDIWPGIIVATVGYLLAKAGFSYYVASFGRYDVVYGSIGAVIVFTVFIYIATITFLLGAECAAHWPEVRDRPPDDGEPGEPFSEEVRRFLWSLVRREDE